MSSDELTFPISEIFGPTIQGEGAMIGRQTLFVRFAGCDYRCEWCDTKYAAYAEEVRAGKKAGSIERLSVEEIVDDCIALTKQTRMWITFSGGNPLLFDFRELVRQLQRFQFNIAVETQGSVMPFPVAVGTVDHLILSPKPPSSEVTTNFTALRTIAEQKPISQRSIKVVVFDEDDLEYASWIREMFPSDQMFLSAGTPQDDLYSSDQAELENVILRRTQWLAEQVTGPRHQDLHNVGVLPQLHALLWGMERGV